MTLQIIAGFGGVIGGTVQRAFKSHFCVETDTWMDSRIERLSLIVDMNVILEDQSQETPDII